MVEKINLKIGDVFCSENPMFLGRMINGMQKFWSADNASQYSHAGIIIDSDGTTFESLGTIRKNHLRKYAGKQVLIGRPVGIASLNAQLAIEEVMADHQKQWYPWWRLIFHIIPPMAKYISSGKFPVCSELVSKYLIKAGVKNIGRWQGKNPDHVSDMIINWKTFNVIFEGTWKD